MASDVSCLEASCVLNLAGQVVLAAQSVSGGYWTNVWSETSPMPLVFPLQRTRLEQMALAGSGTANLYVVFVQGTLEVRENVRMSFLDLHSASERASTSASTHGMPLGASCTGPACCRLCPPGL